jgi:hypothetical protein
MPSASCQDGFLIAEVSRAFHSKEFRLQLKLSSALDGPAAAGNGQSYKAVTCSVLRPAQLVHVFDQDERMVVCGIVRRIQKGDLALHRQVEQSADRRCVLVEFGAVPSAEFRPALRVVAEPLPQGGAGRDFLQP